MIKGFRALAAKDRGEVTAEVTSAVPLNEAQVSELKKTLKDSVGKDVALNTRIDPSLLGGLVVKVASRMIDSSLKTKLQNLRVSLSG
jgi:F-type H+-transporting ATPase subunit delta